MLNRIALLAQLESVSRELFLDFSSEYAIARDSWDRLCSDPTFVYKVRQLKSPWLVPDWQEDLGVAIPVAPFLDPYCVLAVDGSQIYPDRHQGTSCFLINIGTVLLRYKQPGVPATEFSSTPIIFTDAHEIEVEGVNIQDLVNGKRQEFELEKGLEKAQALVAASSATPFLFLFDGSLIFWHLESKEIALKEFFLNKYITLLHHLYEKRIPCAGYISLPKSKELVNLIRIELCNFSVEGCTRAQEVDHVIDSLVARFFLSPQSRSIVFKSNAQIGACYPPHLVPHFFYMDVGSEVVRIEIPAWVARDRAILEMVTQIALDQAMKGRGYPVALAEAHEQAVVKGPDRDFFYHLITKLGIEHKRHLAFSQKSAKKRGMGI